MKIKVVNSMGFKDKLKQAAGGALGNITNEVKDKAQGAIDSAKDALESGLEAVEDAFLNFDFLKNMKEIAVGTGAASVAHTVLSLGSVNENYDLYLNTLSKQLWIGGKVGDHNYLERRVDSWWKTMKGRKYIFNPEETAKVKDNSDTEVKLFFKADDGASVKNKPITLIKEDGKWKVLSLTA